METLSRVKKYEALRKQIENETITVGGTIPLNAQDDLHKDNEIDPSIFKKITVSDDEEPYVPERERNVSVMDEFEATSEEFRNEYLDDFINEVREYNIKKGNRESEDTQIDILNQLQAVSRPKRSDYIQNIDERPEANTQHSEIAAQVMNLIKEEEEDEKNQAEAMVSRFIKEPVSPLVEEAVAHEAPIEATIETPTIEPMVKPIPSEEELVATLQVEIPKNKGTIEETRKKEAPVIKNRKPNKLTKEEQEEEEREALLHKKLVEETQQLRVQLNEYEDDLNDLSEGVEKTNKMLNVILGCLILALLVIIGIIVYWIIQAGGIL